jgi:hypothetical protein
MQESNLRLGLATTLSRLSQSTGIRRSRAAVRVQPISGKTRQRGLTSLVRCERVHDEFFFSPRSRNRDENFLDVAICNWGDLPESNRHRRVHGPQRCRYAKTTIDLLYAGCPGRF